MKWMKVDIKDITVNFSGTINSKKSWGNILLKIEISKWKLLNLTSLTTKLWRLRQRISRTSRDNCFILHLFSIIVKHIYEKSTIKL